MRIEDISPRDNNTVIVPKRDLQSVSGRALCCAISANGRRAYVGGHSGVWRSDDGGLTWRHPERPQPPPGRTSVPGALLAPNVYDLLVSPSSPDVVLAATGRAARRPNPSGIYRSTDGAQNWSRVHTFTGDDVLGSGSAVVGGLGGGGPVSEPVGCLAVAPDDPLLMYAAGGSCVARSRDGGATWADLTRSRDLGAVWYVVVGSRQGPFRRVYAVGSRVLYSLDGGDSWQADPKPINLGPPGDGLGESSRCVGIHPRDPAIVYLIVVISREPEQDIRTLWRGQFPSLPSNRPGEWTQLPVPRTDFPGTTPSGGAFVVPHVTSEGVPCLILSDRRTVHLAVGEPASQGAWRRIEDKSCHLDPHGLALTPDFHPHIPSGPQPPRFGCALLVNDGGANVSLDGGLSWINGQGLSTLGIVNAAVNAVPGKPVALCIGMGDNSGFSSRDGAANWKTQHYYGGDNDCCFADPLHPERLVVFTPRLVVGGRPKACEIYTGSAGNTPDADRGTQQVRRIEGPAFLGGTNKIREQGHNLVSFFYGAGYRPLVMTLEGERPRPDGDLVLIRFTADRALLLRTTRVSELANPNFWETNATSESPSAFTFRQGPPLPDPNICTVQASGGHADPTFYVGDQCSHSSAPLPLFRLWKWKRGMKAWQRLVPRPSTAGPPAPAAARRYFVDPYRPSLVYVLDHDHIWRSDDGGASWAVDVALERAMTEDGAFPVGIGLSGPGDGTADPVLLRDMQFDPFRPTCRFAVGPAGVFHSRDGRNWSTLLRASAMAVHPGNAAYDPVSCERALYVATAGRGLLRLAPIPPDWDYPAGSLQTAVGRITLLRVHDAGSGFGSPRDLLDAEVIVLLDSEPEKAFGIKLRPGADARKAKGMLDLLRDAFRRDAVIRLEFFRSGCRTGQIHRIIET